MIFQIIIILSFVFSAFYFLLVMNFLYGWWKLKVFKTLKKDFSTSVSIIIPARNEEKNILQILNDLIGQNYPKELYEIIVMDDDSIDNTFSVVKDFIDGKFHEESLIKIFSVKEYHDEKFVAFKKRAILKGIEKSNGNWIILTDADCRMKPGWLKTIVAFIEENNFYFVSSPVCFANEKSIFEKMQSLEFLSLIGIGAGSIANKNPNMCNGANLAFRKDVFFEVGGYDEVDHLASGDDEFLMHKIFKKYPDKVAFLKSAEAIVSTSPFNKLKDFIAQRRRWVSKSRKYQRKSVTITLYFVYFYHLLILLNFVLLFFNYKFIIPLIVVFGVKLLSELAFVIPVSKFLSKQKFLTWYIPAAMFYVFYVVIIGIIGNISGYEWKGRRVR